LAGLIEADPIMPRSSEARLFFAHPFHPVGLFARDGGTSQGKRRDDNAPIRSDRRT
jgi:hypothetical protein